MNIIIAPDSFKESLSALEVTNAVEAGFKEVLPDAVYKKIPMADGGEGTVQSIVDATDGKIKELKVKDPLGNTIDAFYGLSGDGRLAIIEMAASSGLDKVPEQLRNPLKTTTWGFGELISDALDEGVEELLLGIGGSATNDGGAGMIMSLGGRLLDVDGHLIKPTGEGLEQLDTIDLTQLHEKVKDVTVRVACDVNNPLTGVNGASYIYGFQKGGTTEQVEYLDQNLTHFAEVIKDAFDMDVQYIPGAGAAGGLGAGLLAFLNASLEPGGKLVVDLLDLPKAIENADLVITGEGGINHQTVFGKTPVAVSQIAKEKEVPVIAICGVVLDGYEATFDEGINAVFSVISKLSTTKEALLDGYSNVKTTARNIAAVINLFKK
ncbi:glycerate kinase [Tetragenococcus halophilus subsp. flandriensis]|uniref:glycerate kinase n=1 Tax=Tetragenococcus halophilus TaxID=51669 RepID=UPI0023E98A0C|nr:glycerate kinase [Tetragenococcus halophilus]GMA08460.1 glycerate kinase [Tetragenococcus halophilus subsp. flandriensis]